MKRQKSPPMVSLTFELSREDRKLLEEAAELDEVTMSAVVRRGIRDQWREAKKRALALREKDAILRAS